MNKRKTTYILTLFLLGIFMGAIDSGIVSPAREIIQNSFGVNRAIGTWMITLYTLVYAVSMPITSKLSDRYGYKTIYILGISLFGVGSLLAGLANFYGTFPFFLVARAIQAIGAGGIMPIANNVIGQSFPEEKRGTALGLVGAIYGVATIFGPTLGSFILDIAGTSHWGWVFFINVPISIGIIVFSYQLDNEKNDNKQPLDLVGALVIAVLIGSLMYSLTNLDFFNLSHSFIQTNVYPYLIVFLLLIPLFIFVERKAKDPVLNIKYFRNKQMVITLILAFLVGVGMMGMVFVPQFAENVLKIKAGSGGYLVTLLAVFSGIAAPVSGKLIDKKGARLVLFIGFGCTLVGTLVMALIVTKVLTFVSILVGLAFMGFGVGFTMGPPLNYIVLQSVPKKDGATALATMSLVRSIGVTISPSIMIGFIVQAAKKLQPNLMKTMSENLTLPKGMDLSTMGQNSNGAKAFSALQNSDVTTIVDDLKNAFSQVIPTQVSSMVLQSVEGIRSSLEKTFQQTLNTGYAHMFFAAASFAFVGFIFTFFLNKTHKQIQE